MSAFQQQHYRSESSDTSSYGSSGSAYQLILDHVLSYPGSYEIPLRTMYTLNCAPRAQPKQSSRSESSSSASSSPVQSQCAWQDHQATQTFTENLMAQISQLPSQPTSLPPSFITSFARRCFPPDLMRVDFPQALTGLDYLKDLETRRRREVAAAMSRLAIDRTTLDLDTASLSDRYPGVLQWVKSIEEKERKVEALYTQVYVALRRWIMINELSLLPYNKHNCVAMLNTLYPPVNSTQPTSKLTPEVLKGQRDGFFKYILSVEKNGPRMLSNLMQQGRAAGEDNGWPAVTRTLAMYLQLANSIITECVDIVDVEDVSPRNHRDSGGSRTGRKVDSGVSFNNTERLPSFSSAASTLSSPTEIARPKTPSGSRSGTTLEKLARGLKTIGRSRTDATEMVTGQVAAGPTPAKAKGLRKMRSMGALNSQKAFAASPGAEASSAFDAHAMRRQRMNYEAATFASQKLSGRQQSHEV